MRDDLQERLGAIMLSWQDVIQQCDDLCERYPELAKLLGLAFPVDRQRQYFEDNIAFRVRGFIAAYDEVNHG